MKNIRTLILIAAVAGLTGCDVAGNGITPDRDFAFRQFGDRCGQHAECESTYCMAYEQGSFCTKLCDDGCPDGWSCAEVDNPHGEGRVSLCTLERRQICTPCAENSACGFGNSNWCMEIGSGSFCAQDCSYQGCPEGYECRDVEDGAGLKGRQCMPLSGSCVCDEESIGQMRGCARENKFGRCQGMEVCGADGEWTACSAQEPAEEVCDGIDNDCDGFIDEDTDGAECAVTNEFGTCRGTELCAGMSGIICQSATPSEEVCNGMDDDCDGEIDEGFKNEHGSYVSRENCGVCGQNCDLLMPHATETTCVEDGGQAQCRALACEKGYFLYMDGVTCMALPDNLCMACSNDAECVGPGSLCVEMGQESFCGRDCGKDSPYGVCPEGYKCSLVRGDKMQCVPETETCICNADNVESARSCKVDTCEGFEWCRRSPGEEAYTWSECEISSYNPEICDGLDNNCDGVIDEGMRDPVTGLYTSQEHCGYCFNDCSSYFKPEIDHVEGVCIVSSGTASCGMGPCAEETISGLTYEWVNTDGLDSNGCECRRVKGNLTKDDPDVANSYGTGIAYTDQNCDGIDGVIKDAIFVSRGAEVTGKGTIDAPFARISEALRAWPGAGKKYILVAEGIYEEDISLPNGAVLHGGYSVNFRSRDPVLHASVIRGGAGNAAVSAVRLTEQALVEGFVIEGAARTAPGMASIAVLIQNTPRVTFKSNQIRGGTGGMGEAGAGGRSGNGSKEDPRLNGGPGVNSIRYDGPCLNDRQEGGSAGVNVMCRTANATPGGSTVCPGYDWDKNMGNRAEYHTTERNRGLGGFDNSFDKHSGVSCSHATESGYPTDIKDDVAEDGRSGACGVNGGAGRGSTDAYGSIRGGLWVTAAAAGRGGNGTHGAAGGGGGGGGGVAYYHFSENDCPKYEIGPTGGGGGAGGCGGGGGNGGGGGGASIGVFISNARYTNELPVIEGNVFVRGRGGDGGAGGVGGAGGAGGRGGDAGIAGDWLATRGGRGGNGGSGGRGGGGGGGAGGPSFDIMGYNAGTYALVAKNAFAFGDKVARGGTGGSGGVGGAGESGKTGVDGASARQIDLRVCGTGKSCKTGYRCNSDNICIPER